jgi:hypothetical protein
VMTPAEIVEKQANDIRLWMPAQTPIEAYLQHALRVLHAAIDGEPLPYYPEQTPPQ